MNPPGSRPSTWAIEFEKWLDSILLSSNDTKTTKSLSIEERLQALQTSPSTAPHFRKAHPREEHFIPLLVAAGAAFANIPNEIITTADGNIVDTSSSSSTSTNSSTDTKQQQPLPGTVTKLYSQFVLGSMSLASYRFD